MRKINSNAQQQGNYRQMSQQRKDNRAAQKRAGEGKSKYVPMSNAYLYSLNTSCALVSRLALYNF